MSAVTSNIVQDLNLYIQSFESGEFQQASQYYQQAQQDIKSLLNNPKIPQSLKDKLNQVLKDLQGTPSLNNAYNALNDIGGAETEQKGGPLPINPEPTPLNPSIEPLNPNEDELR